MQSFFDKCRNYKKTDTYVTASILLKIPKIFILRLKELVVSKKNFCYEILIFNEMKMFYFTFLIKKYGVRGKTIFFIVNLYI